MSEGMEFYELMANRYRIYFCSVLGCKLPQAISRHYQEKG